MASQFYFEVVKNLALMYQCIVPICQLTKFDMFRNFFSFHGKKMLIVFQPLPTVLDTMEQTCFAGQEGFMGKLSKH